MRREFPDKVKLAAWDRCGGNCEQCKTRIVGQRPEYDHILPDAMGGEPTLENCMVMCRKCHGLKTYTADVPRIAKTKRTKRKTAGVTKSKNPLPGSRGSKWKRKMNGEVEAR